MSDLVTQLAVWWLVSSARGGPCAMPVVFYFGLEANGGEEDGTFIPLIWATFKTALTLESPYSNSTPKRTMSASNSSSDWN